MEPRTGRKLRTDTHTHTQIHTRDNYSNPRCAHVRRGLIKYINYIPQKLFITISMKNERRSSAHARKLNSACIAAKVSCTRALQKLPELQNNSGTSFATSSS